MDGNSPDSPKGHIPPEHFTQATVEHLDQALGHKILMSNYTALILIIWPCSLTHSKTPHTVGDGEKQKGTRMHAKNK